MFFSEGKYSCGTVETEHASKRVGYGMVMPSLICNKTGVSNKAQKESNACTFGQKTVWDTLEAWPYRDSNRRDLSFSSHTVSQYTEHLIEQNCSYESLN